MGNQINPSDIRRVKSNQEFMKKSEVADDKKSEKQKVTIKTNDVVKMALFPVKGEDELENPTYTVQGNGYEITLNKDEFKGNIFDNAAVDSHDKQYNPEAEIEFETEAAPTERPITKTEYQSINWEQDENGGLSPEFTQGGSIQVMDSDGTIRLVNPDAIMDATEKYAPKEGTVYEATTGEKVMDGVMMPFKAVGTAYDKVLGDHDGRASLKIANNPWGLKTAGVVGEVAAVATDAVSVVAEGGEKAVGYINGAVHIDNTSYDKTTTNALIDTSNSITSVLGVVEGLFQAVKGGFDTGSSLLKMEDMSNEMLEKVRDKALENIAKIHLDSEPIDDDAKQMFALFEMGDTREARHMIIKEAFARQLVTTYDELEELNKKPFDEMVEILKTKLNCKQEISERQVEDSSALFSIGFRLGLTPEQMEGKSNSELRAELKRQKEQKLGMYKSMSSEQIKDLYGYAYNALTIKNYDFNNLSDYDRQKLIDLGVTREEVVLLAADLAADAELAKLAALVVEQRADGISNFQAGVTRTSESVGKVADLPSNILKVAESTDIPVIKEVTGVASGALDTATGAVGTALNGAVDLITGNWNFDRTKKSAQKTANGAKHMVTLGHGKDIYHIDGIDSGTMQAAGLDKFKSDYKDENFKELTFYSIPIADVKDARKDKATGLWVVGGTLFLSDTSYKNLCKMAKKHAATGSDSINTPSAVFLPEITKAKYIQKAKDLGNNTYKIDTGVFGSEIISAQEYKAIIDNYNLGKKDNEKIAYPESLTAFLNTPVDNTTTIAVDTATAAAVLSKKDQFIEDGMAKYAEESLKSINSILSNKNISEAQRKSLVIAAFKTAITESSLTAEQIDKMAVIIAAKIAENDSSFALAILTGAYKCTGELNDGELGVLKRSLALFVGPVGNALQGAYEHPVTAIAGIPLAIAAPGITYAVVGGTDSAYGIKKAIIDDNFNDTVATYETTRILKPFWWHHGHHKKCVGNEPEPQPPTPVDPWCPQVPVDPWCP